MPRKVKLQGEGIKDFVDSKLNKRPKVLSAYLQKCGDYIINRIISSRTPVQSAVQGALNFLTSGSYQKIGND